MDPNQQNPYEFILATDSTSKNQFLKSKVHKIIAGTLFVCTVLGLAIIGFVFFSSLGSSDTEGHETALAQLTELDRILESQNKNIQDVSLKFDATTLHSIVLTDIENMRTILKNRGVKLTKAQLNSAKNTKTDDNLASSIQQNQFDDTYVSVINKQLSLYEDSLRRALMNSDSRQESATLKKSLDNIASLSVLASE